MRCLKQVELNLCLLFCLAYITVTSSQQELGTSFLIDTHYQNSLDPECEIYKVTLTQISGNEYVQYKSEFPEIEEYTLCFWTKLETHDRNQPLFSYTVSWKKCEICSWIINTEESSYLSMTVAGHTLFRLNYPLKLRKWYHICESWNGKTGEWQVWVNAERVGRGFYNRLVGYKIPAGGVIISGQERKLGEHSSDLYTGKEKGPRGMVGEITMVQFYKVALTAGKAHKNHKHHHAHKYDHHGNQITTTPSPKLPKKPTTTTQVQSFRSDPRISGKQLNLASYRLRDSLAPVVEHPILSGDVVFSSSDLNSATYRFNNHHLLKRQAKEHFHYQRKRETLIAGGTILEGSLFGETLYEDTSPLENSGTSETKDDESSDKEPAEAEVRSIMNICSGCEEEPFGKALVMGWRNTSKIVTSQASYVRAINECGMF